jgi:hypothetical protein
MLSCSSSDKILCPQYAARLPGPQPRQLRKPRTPGGHRCHHQQQQQRVQEEQEVTSAERPTGNQAPRLQNFGQNNQRSHNNEEVATLGVDACEIINATRQGRLSDNADRFPALSSAFADAEYPKDFKLAILQKYDGKQDPAQWLCLYSTVINVAGGDTATKVLYFQMVLESAPLTWLENLKSESIHS